jgi:DNA-binding beta-propeller fold protein YncE
MGRAIVPVRCITAALALAGCASAQRGMSPGNADAAAEAGAPPSHLLYASLNDGTVHVYDIDDGHREVKSLRAATGVGEVRGACANASPGVLYVSYKASDGGHVVAIDLHADQVLWNKTFLPGVDRLACTPDGKKLYVPSNESFMDDELIVVDAASGAELTRIHHAPRAHDALGNLAGGRVYFEAKSSNLVAQIDTTTDTIIEKIGPFAGIVGPFTLNGAETRIYGNVFGLNGFQVGDITTGQALETVEIPGQASHPGGLNQHGIGLTPDEKEIWVVDGLNAVVHVFDATVSPPTETHQVRTTYPGLHWITFTIDGRFAYPSVTPMAGALDTDVVDTATYSRVGKVGPSEEILEIDFAGSEIVRIGSQFGVGRIP